MKWLLSFIKRELDKKQRRPWWSEYVTKTFEHSVFNKIHITAECDYDPDEPIMEGSDDKFSDLRDKSDNDIHDAKDSAAAFSSADVIQSNIEHQHQAAKHPTLYLPSRPSLTCFSRRT